MNNKPQQRHKIIVDLVGSGKVGNQAELGRMLQEQGIHTTQATLSRDLKTLCIGKRPTPSGSYVYVLSNPEIPVNL